MPEKDGYQVNTKPQTQQSILNLPVISWSLYDFANTIFSMNIVSLYLKRYIVEDLGYTDHYFDISFSISMLVAALLLPALGALSDHSTKKKIFLILFTLTCCLSVGLMSLVPAEAIMILMALFILANFSYEAGQPFYNALLYSVADGKQARFVSGVGVSLGYVGAIVGLIVVMPFVNGHVFSIDVPFIDGSGKPGAFLPTAVLFILFALPLFAWVKEAPVHRRKKIKFSEAYRDVWDGLRQTKKYPGVLRFLIADYFFEDAVATVNLNIGIYCSLVIGFSDGDISLFLIISTISAVVGSFIIGKIAQYWSLKNLLTVIVSGWSVALLLFVITDNIIIIWALGSLVGVLMGGLWTTSRPFLAEMVPREDLGRFFGIFSLSGRAAAVIGPLLWTTVVYLFASSGPLGKNIIRTFEMDASFYNKLPYKIGVMSLVMLMLIGLYIFRKVPHTQRSHG